MSQSSGPDKAATSSPISDALYNPDIIETLFLLFDDTKQEECADLYHLALVCKSFKGPALNRIWESMSSCIPLLDLLPHLEEVDEKMYFYGNLANSSFCEYANRVKKLRLISSKEYGLKFSDKLFSEQVFSRLSKELNGSPLLPNLRRMEISRLNAVTKALLPLLYYENLESLEYTPKGSSAAHLHQFVFPSLQEYSPALSKLTVTIEEPIETPFFPTLILNSVFSLARLRHLEVRAIATLFNPADVAELGARCPELTTLHLDICFNHPSMFRCPDTPKELPELFANLENVHLTVRNASTCHFDPKISITLCNAWPPSLISKLTSLTIFVSQRFEAYDGLLDSLAKSPNFRRLEFTNTTDSIVTDLRSNAILGFLQFQV
ncbi:hypothetical protein BKA70DRAFT_676417, partial [Coprinopsis sp. MPI-PUGE-AT-0042]